MGVCSLFSLSLLHMNLLAGRELCLVQCEGVREVVEYAFREARHQHMILFAVSPRPGKHNQVLCGGQVTSATWGGLARWGKSNHQFGKLVVFFLEAKPFLISSLGTLELFLSLPTLDTMS